WRSFSPAAAPTSKSGGHALRRGLRGGDQDAADQLRKIGLGNEDRARHLQLLIERVDAARRIDHGQIWKQLTGTMGKGQTVDAVGKIDIGKEDVDSRRFEVAQR